jgi:NAD(P)-dependent dehydrogenase (short-subunit alcohol dehydrogenase family)
MPCAGFDGSGPSQGRHAGMSIANGKEPGLGTSRANWAGLMTKHELESDLIQRQENPPAGTYQAGGVAGKSIFVTGGASGLGAALCHALAQAGAKVMVADLQLERAQELAAGLRQQQGQAQAVVCDVGDPDSVRNALAATVETWGGLDVLINNAGTDKTLSVEELEIADWNRVLATNLSGPFLMSKFALPHLKASGGQIINIASTAAKRAWPNASAYHASKWGLLGLSHAMHAELRPQGIKVTAVIAGGMRTPFLLDRFPDIDIETLQDPANVAAAVLSVLQLPASTVIPEIMVLPMRESSWP